MTIHDGKATSSRIDRRKRLPSGPKGHWLLGSTMDYMRDPLGFLERAAREYGDIFQLRLGNTRTYVLVHPELIDQVLHSQHKVFIKDKLTRLLTPVLGDGLLTSDGDFWRRQRKLAQPAFSMQQVRRYGEEMVAQTERMLDGWNGRFEGDFRHEMMRLTLEIVAKTLFNAEIEEQVEQIGASLDVVQDYFDDPTRWFRIREYIPTPATVRHRQAIRRLDRTVYGVIRQRRAGGEDPGDLLSRLLAAQDDEGTGMTDRHLRDEIVTLLLAGHETTALALTYTFHLLARHPEAEARLLEELNTVLGDRPATPEDLPNLPYADGVIKEAMRLYPPAWGIARESLEDVEIGGYDAPKGTQFFMIQWLVHRDPRWFDEPTAFHPERWLDGLEKRLPRCAYFPFGDGPRICIGQHFALMEAVLILATIARRYRLAVLPGQELSVAPSITLRPIAGTLMTALERIPS